MEDLSVDYNAKHYSYDAERKISKFIYEKVKGKNDIVILCFGTSTNNGDSIGPLTGTTLKEYGIKNVFGTLDSPIDAYNLKRRVKEIKAEHSNSYIIAVDAAAVSSLINSTGRPYYIKRIFIEEGAMTPATLYVKNAEPVGDLSISAIMIYDRENNCEKKMKEVDLGIAYNVSQVIANSIKIALTK